MTTSSFSSSHIFPLHSQQPNSTSFSRPNLCFSRSRRFKCWAGETGFFTKLGRLIKEKAKSDVEKIFSGFSKTRDNLAVVDELLLYWNLADTDRVLDQLEEIVNSLKARTFRERYNLFINIGHPVLPLTRGPEARLFIGVRAQASGQHEVLLVADFGPRITFKIVDRLRDDINAGKLKSGAEIKDALKRCILDLLTAKGLKTELQLGFRKPAVIMIIGVNGGGKTTSLGKLAHRLSKEGTKVLLAAGDTFRAAASDQLEIWAERTGCEIVVAEKENEKAALVLSQAVKRGKLEGYDIVLCDTSGRLHTNYRLMDELVSCKKAIGKVVPKAPNEILQVLDGTTGLNMLPQAREFNDVVGVTGLILTKLDGTARGGCVVSVVDELGIPVKFVGVGEGIEDLQPFDAEAFVNAIIP